MSILGIYTMPTINNSTNVLILMVSTKLICYYIYNIEDFTTFSTRKNVVKMERLTKSKINVKMSISLLKQLIKTLTSSSKKYILLFFHALLTLLLTFDKKDYLTVGMLTVEAFVIPIHIYCYINTTSSKNFTRILYRSYLPVFALSIFFVLFRYILFFQK